MVKLEEWKSLSALAIYDHDINSRIRWESLIPEHPIDLKVKCRYRLRIEEIEEELLQSSIQDPMDVIESLIGSCPGPENLVLNHDHYLNGLPKRELNH